MRRSWGRQVLCSWLAASIAVGGCRSPQPASVSPPPAAPSTPIATPAPSGRPEVALADLPKGKLDLVLSTGSAPTGRATVTELDAARTTELLARLEPLPDHAATNANAPVLRASTPPPSSGRPATPIAFLAPTGKAVAPGALATPTGTTEPMTAPTILPSGPIRAEVEVRVRFAEPMVPVAKVGEVAAPPARILPAVAGTWRWIDTRVLGFFARDARLPQATTFTVTVPAGAKSLSGRSLATDASTTFTTAPVAMSGALPELVRPDSAIVVQLDQAVTPAAIAPFLRVETRAGKRLPIRVVDAATATASWAPLPRDSVQTKHPAPNRVYLAPQTAWPADTQLRVVLAKGAPSAEGALLSLKPDVAGVRVVPAFTLEGVNCRERVVRGPVTCPAESYASIKFTNPIEEASYRADKLQFVGDEMRDHTMSYDEVSLWIPDEEFKRFTLAIGDGLTDVYGQPYRGPRQLPLTTTRREYTPYLYTHEGFHILDPRFTVPQWVIKAEAVSRIAIELYKVTPADYFAFEAFEAGTRTQPPGKRVFASSHLVGARNGADLRVDLRPALSSEVGHVIAIARVTPSTAVPKDQFARVRSAWIQVTKLGVTARYDGDKLSAWARDISPAHFLAPVAAAQVSVLRAAQRGGTVATATSDAAGNATFELPPPIMEKSLPTSTPSLVVVSRGGDSTFAVFGADRAQRSEQARWYITDDRFTYKPGEKAYLKGWVRWSSTGVNPDLAQPRAGEKVVWSLVDAKRTQIASGIAPLSDQGGFDVAVDLPATVNLGTATFSLSTRTSTARHAISVQEFRTPAYRVSLEDDVQYSGARPLLAGESIEMRVEAGYYAGGGLPGAEVRWAATLAPTTYRPPSWDRYAFDQPVTRGDRTSYYRRSPRGGSFDVAETSALSGSSSQTATISAPALPDAGPAILSVDATVADLDRMQIRASSRSILVHPSRVYVGLRQQPGRPGQLEVIVTDIDGNPVAGVPTEVELEAVLGSERYRDDAKVTDTQRCTFTSTTAPHACPWTRRSHDYHYTATATVRDERGRRNHAQYELPWWTSDDKRELSLTPDKPLYRVGDTAKINITSASLPATAVITVARNGIIRQTELPLTAATTTFEVPIEAAFVSDVHIVVDRWSMKATPQTGSKLPFPVHVQAELDVSVDLDSARIEMTARAKKPLVQPGAMATFEVRAKRDDKPLANAEVALMVIDEAVLSLSSRSHADPLAQFYQQYPARAALLTNLNNVVDQGLELDGAPGFTVFPLDRYGTLGHGSGTGSGYGVGNGHGGMAGASSVVSARKDFRPVAVFAPLLHTDANGLAIITVKMPENLTRFRVVAIATANNRYFGKAEGAITTQRLISVRTIAPRFLTQGDRFAVPVLVQNLDAAPRTIDVAVRGANLTSTGPAGKRVVLDAGQRAELRFELATVARGTASIQTILASGDATDASLVAVPVYEPATTETFGTYGIVDDVPAAEQIAVPANVFPSVGGLEVELASTQLQSLTDAFWYLYAYPYECAEQRSARMLATSAMYDVLDAFATPGRPSRDELAKQRSLDATKLAKDQRADGTWGYFGGMRGDPFVTLQVLTALAAQDMKGPMRTKAQAAVLKTTDAELALLARPSLQKQASRVSLVAASLSALAIAGVDVRARVDRLHQLATRLDAYPIDAKARVLAMTGGSATMRKALLTALLSATHETASTAAVTTTYTEGERLLLVSERKTDALVLDALMREAPDHALIPKLVRGLLTAQRGGRWRSTQENLVALTVLRHYFDRYEKTVPAFTGKLWLGSAAYAEHPFVGRTSARASAAATWTQLAPGSTHALSLAKDGPGRMYYRVGITYAPKQQTFDALDAGFVVRRTYTPLDDPRDVQHLADGTWQIRLGARVLVTLQATVTSVRHDVAFVDPLPAGLEPVNSALATAERPATVATDSRWDFRNLRDNRAEVFVTELHAGTHQFSYTARATTPGTFVAAPAKAEEMYSPETFGRSASGNVLIN